LPTAITVTLLETESKPNSWLQCLLDQLDQLTCLLIAANYKVLKVKVTS